MDMDNTREILKKRKDAMDRIEKYRKETGIPTDEECDRQFYEQNDVDMSESVEIKD